MDTFATHNLIQSCLPAQPKTQTIGNYTGEYNMNHWQVLLHINCLTVRAHMLR